MKPQSPITQQVAKLILDYSDSTLNEQIVDRFVKEADSIRPLDPICFEFYLKSSRTPIGETCRKQPRSTEDLLHQAQIEVWNGQKIESWQDLATLLREEAHSCYKQAHAVLHSAPYESARLLARWLNLLADASACDQNQKANVKFSVSPPQPYSPFQTSSWDPFE